ncbi:6-phosphogluconolactonase [Latimeria chalumnae]|uniref:6-phosphogluconolactonase n=1 Tax=Latimeria chalumnae TaxID=7897 RepID=H3AHH1_LATCH|nr:PREDICTED: 6-phosphogluconolactonase [Latimeria chalumnae]|eukprot:XP_006002979.1 PREDICTED: 6-phosphogluconolactonase [Latimeria chalumnae]
MPGAQSVRILSFPSARELGPALARFVSQRAAEASRSARGRFAVAVSGGSVVSLLSAELPRSLGVEDWGKWLLAFCDERLVPFEDPESTFGLYRTHLLSKVPIAETQVITINPSLSVDEAAEDYAKKLKEAFPGEDVPVFDLLILGMGPDGHTCSLFPDHPLLQETQKIVAAIGDSPKPPPQRVTLTLPVLNAARTVLFVATGESKAAVLKRILEGKEASPLPAARVQPRDGELHWFLDESAAKELTISVEKRSG